MKAQTCAVFTSRTFSLLCIFALLFGAVATQAATRTWDGSFGIYWSSALNWVGGVRPYDGDTVVFPAGAANKANSNNISGLNLETIEFTGGGYTVSGNGVGLTGEIKVSNGSDANTVNMDIVLDDSMAFRVFFSTSSLDITGDIALGSHTLTVYNGGAVDLSGIISGTGNLNKTGFSGTLRLSGSSGNTYSGNTSVMHGTLELAKTTGESIDGGTLTIGNGTGGADSAIVRTAAGAEIATIPITINSDGWLDHAYNATEGVGAITFNGGHAGSSGTGLLNLAGDVTVNAASTEAIFDGEIAFYGGTRTIQVGNGAVGYDLRVNAVISGSYGFVKTGAGLMSLHGANSYSGETTINAGRLYVGNDSAFGATSGGTTIEDSGFMQLLGGVNIGAEPLTLARTSAGSVIYASSGDSSWAGDILLNEDAEIGCYSQLGLSGVISGSGGLTFTGAGTLLLNGADDNTYAGITTVNAGILELNDTASAHEMVPGNLVINDGGTLLLTEGHQIADSATVTVFGTGMLDLNNYSETLAGLSLQDGGDVSTGTGSLALGNNSEIEFSGTSSTISGNLNVGTGICTITSSSGRLFLPCSVSGSANVQLDGTGITYLHLQGANTFSGTLTLNGGYTYATHADAFGDTSSGTALEGGGALRINNNIHVMGEALTCNSSSSSALRTTSGSSIWEGTLSLARDTAVLVDGAGNQLTLDGAVGGAGGFTKTGDGTLVFSAAGNTYTGDTSVQEGVLELSANNVIREGTLTVGTGAGPMESVIVRFLADNVLHSNADIFIQADGLLDFNDHSDYVGDILFDRGQLKTGSGTYRLGGDVTVVENSTSNWTANIFGIADLGSGQRTFDVDLDAYIDLSAPTKGSGGINKTGGGALQLGEPNTYEGITDVQDGSLKLWHAESLGATNGRTVVQSGATMFFGKALTITDEALELNGGLLWCAVDGTWNGPVEFTANSWIGVDTGDQLDVDGAISGAGTVIKAGGGTLVYTGSDANTYTGNTYVNVGTLLLEKSVPNGAVVGDLYIGDGAGADVVEVSGRPQIANDSRVVIAGSGLLDISRVVAAPNEAIGSLDGSGRVILGTKSLKCGENNASTLFSGIIEGSGGVWKDGTGIFTLTGNNTYSGATEVRNGTLLVNGSQPASDIEVSSSGTLGGIGTVGAISSAGSVAPGNSAGQLGCSGATLDSSSSFDVELNGYNLLNYDQLDVNGKAVLGNSGLNIAWGFVPALGDAFTILENDGVDAVVGTFNGLAEGASVVAGNVTLQVSYQGGSGNDIVLAATAVEPLEELVITSVAPVAGNIDFEWVGGVPPFRVEKKTSLTNATWTAVTAPSRDFDGSVPVDTTNGFYRVTGGN